MGNKEDWEEIERWNKEYDEKNIKQFGVDISKVDLEKQRKTSDVLTKTGSFFYNVVKYIIIVIIVIGLGGGLWFAFVQFEDFGARFDIGDAEEYIERLYNIKIIEIAKDTDNEGNGKYEFALRSNEEIVFNAVKNRATLFEDYRDNCHKYYFENWNSEDKKAFIIDEKVEDGLLDFSTYIEVKEYNEIETAIKKINSFVEYSKEYFNAGWQVYLKKDDFFLYPYSILEYPEEEVIANAKKRYLNYLRNMNIDENIPDEELKKYLTGPLLDY